ncbi:TrmH family RNA methyltransferase [Arcanobacterium pluranimalium]|uniref:TrmH family RNA methyltransferase n=1 Tax=Arcanobacterium pluranimalium TaxID=108028 RepID=UPI0019590A80|nr:RNA methyltransferase [Arcanobacterium pluranimalium]MBM7825303.1 TrmH family RNA methyltransferase [Arcanobacterium pluranimalium]
MTGQLKKVLGLFRRSNRYRYVQAVVEGPQAVRELLKFAPELIRDVYATNAALNAHRDIDELLKRHDPYTHILSEELCNRLSSDAQGILAVMNIADEPDLDEIFAQSQLLVMAVNGSDPGNVGTIIRSADAAGANAVVLGHGSVDASNPKVIRSSVGSVFHLPIIEDEHAGDVVERAHAHGFIVLLADGAGQYKLNDLSDAACQAHFEGRAVEGLDLRARTLWLVGNEAHGFTDEQRKLADYIVSVPMWGHTESLNVAMATTLCLYASAQAQAR